MHSPHAQIWLALGLPGESVVEFLFAFKEAWPKFYLVRLDAKGAGREHSGLMAIVASV